jgi:hypothetical protein
MFFFEPIGGMYREFLGVKTILEPKDETLFRSLLPSQFPMPAQAAVTLFIADYLKVASWPFKILPWSMTRYQEGAVSLKGVYQGVEGWFNLHHAGVFVGIDGARPLHAWFPQIRGRRHHPEEIEWGMAWSCEAAEYHKDTA